MAERPEDVSMVSQTSEPAMPDSDGKLYKYLVPIKKKTPHYLEFKSKFYVCKRRLNISRGCSWAHKLNHLHLNLLEESMTCSWLWPISTTKQGIFGVSTHP